METSMSIISPDGGEWPLTPYYFLANFSMFCGEFSRQQELTDLGTPLYNLAIKGAMRGLSGDAINKGADVLEALRRHVEGANLPKQRESILMHISSVGKWVGDIQ